MHNNALFLSLIFSLFRQFACSLDCLKTVQCIWWREVLFITRFHIEKQESFRLSIWLRVKFACLIHTNATKCTFVVTQRYLTHMYRQICQHLSKHTLPMERYGESLSGHGSNSNIPTERRTIYHCANRRPNICYRYIYHKYLCPHSTLWIYRVLRQNNANHQRMSDSVELLFD